MLFSLNTNKRFILCFVSSLLVCLSFPNYFELTLLPKTAFLGWIALVPLFLALDEAGPRLGALLGWFFGFVQFGCVLYWIGLIEAAKALSWLGWFSLAFYLSLYFLVFGFLFTALKPFLRLGLFLAPILWVGLEYLRGTRPWGGFPWCELGYSQAPFPAILTFTSWFGIYGLTFLMVWFNASTAHGLALLLKGEKRSLAPITTALVALGIVLVSGSLGIGQASFERKGVVAMLQASVPQEEKWSKENEKKIYQKFAGLVDSLASVRPDLILWPETAAPNYLSWAPDALRTVEGIVKRSKAYHLIGCLDAIQGAQDPKTRSFNAAMAFSPDGQPSGTYHKRHLVPFGEFVPFQKYLTFLGPVVGDLGNFDPGDCYKLFWTKKFSYTPTICYEVIFPGDMDQATRTQADVLVNISNDAWYGKTASAYQHAQMALVRAAEHHKSLLRCSNAGICLATDPFGKILDSTKLFESRTFVSDVLVLKGKETFYSVCGDWLPLTCLFLSFVFLLFLLAKRVQVFGS